MIITSSNANLDTGAYTIEGIFAHPIHGSLYSQVDKQINGSLTRQQTAILRTMLKSEDELIRVNVDQNSFEIQIVDVAKHNIVYVIQPYSSGEYCTSDPSLLKLEVADGMVCIPGSECFTVSTWLKYNQSQGFLVLPTTNVIVVHAPFPYEIPLEAALFCVSP